MTKTAKTIHFSPMTFRHWRLIGVLIIALFGVSVLCWYIADRIVFAPTLSSRDSAIEQTRELVDAAKDHPTGPVPDTLPGYLRGGIGCWSLFQHEMAQEANQYAITIISAYDSRESSKPSRGMTEVWLQVDFSDHRRAKIYYYQGGLTGCGEVQD